MNKTSHLSIQLHMNYCISLTTSYILIRFPNVSISFFLVIQLSIIFQTLFLQLRYDDDDDADGPAPDPALEYGMPLPIRLAAEFPPELVATPIEDIDSFYQNKKVCCS